MTNIPLWDYIRTDIDSVTVPQECLAPAPTHRHRSTTTTTSKTSWSSVSPSGRTRPTATNLHCEHRLHRAFCLHPQVAEANLATSPVHINNYVPAFLQKIYQSGKKVGNQIPSAGSLPVPVGNPTGWYMHEAGRSSTAAGTTTPSTGVRADHPLRRTTRLAVHRSQRSGRSRRHPDAHDRTHQVAPGLGALNRP